MKITVPGQGALEVTRSLNGIRVGCSEVLLTDAERLQLSRILTEAQPVAGFRVIASAPSTSLHAEPVDKVVHDEDGVRCYYQNKPAYWIGSPTSHFFRVGSFTTITIEPIGGK